MLSSGKPAVLKIFQMPELMKFIIYNKAPILQDGFLNRKAKIKNQLLWTERKNSKPGY